MKVETVKAKKSASWADIEEKLNEARKGGMVTQVFTNAADAPDIALNMFCNSIVYKADENYCVMSTGERIELA